MTQQTPYGWMIQGSTQVWFGEHAELDANAEAMRCGGTCTAFAIYIEPVAVPDDWAELLSQSRSNYLRQFGCSTTADWVYADLIELFEAAPQPPQGERT